MARQASGGGGRSVLSAVCGLLAIVLLPVSLVGFWAAVLLTRTDVFVEELRPVVAKPQVQEALTDGLVQGVLGAVHLQPAIEKALEVPLRAQAAALVASPQVADAWTTGIRAVHTQFIDVMQGRADTRLDDQGRVSVAVTIPVPALTSTLEQAGVPNAGSLAPVVTIPLVKAADLQNAQTGIPHRRRLGPVGAAGRRRRWRCCPSLSPGAGARRRRSWPSAGS